MTSVGSYFSQVAPFKRYATEPGQTGLLYDATGTVIAAITVASGAVLRDMGKTVIIAAGGGTPLRKVQILPVAAANDYGVGYIYLENVPVGQNIVALN